MKDPPECNEWTDTLSFCDLGVFERIDVSENVGATSGSI